MPSSPSEARARVAWLALIAVPAWACATAIDNAPRDSSPLAVSGASGEPSAAGSGNSNASSGSPNAGNGSSAGAGKGGATGSAGSGASGAAAQSGAPGSAGKGGASSAGAGSGGVSSAGAAGKASSGGASSGGNGGISAAGTSGAGTSSAGTSSAGTSSAGTSSAGTTGSSTCNAAHAVATLATQEVYNGKDNDCIRLSVNPSWSVINLQFQPLPGTGPYPVPFSFFSCGGNGTGSLLTDYANVTFKTGANPGCDYFVQFGGNGGTIKVTYYD